MTSEEQIQANKANSQLSTGPQDTSKTRFNALTHGLLSKELYIKRKWINESPEEYKQLLQFFIEDLKPADMTEHILVERIAVSYWRLRRTLAAEQDIVISHGAGVGLLAHLVAEEEETNKRLNFSMERVDSLIRYEAMLERQFYRALHELEKRRQQPIISKLTSAN